MYSSKKVFNGNLQVIQNSTNRNFYIKIKSKRFSQTLLQINIGGQRLISTPGCSLSAGWALSLLGINTPAGSHLSHTSRRSLAPSAPIN
jgi:hypothetical protein